MILNSVQIVALRLNENEVKSFVEYEINMSYAYGEKMDYNKIIIILVIILIAIVIGGFLILNQTGNKTTNATNSTNATNVTNVNLTNNTTDSTEINQNNRDSEYSQGKTNSKEVPSDIYSRWDTDGDGMLSSGEIDVHDKALGQGKYYTGHENMKDSATTYPD